MKSISLTKLSLGALVAIIVTGVVLQLGLFQRRSSEPVMDEILRTQTLKVLTRNLSTTYYLDQEEPAGPEYELAAAFARSLGVKPVFLIEDGLEELFLSLEAGEGHLAAAGITRTDAREQRLDFGLSYQTIQQQVVCHRDAELPEQPVDLLGRHIAVIADSSYSETLNLWREEFADLSWKESREHSTEQILQAIAGGEVDCTLADSNIVAVNRRYLPELTIAFAASEPQSLAWALPKGATRLQKRLNRWLEKKKTRALIAEVLHRHYGHVDLFDYVDTNVFQRRIENRLPKYQELFEQVATEHGFPWTLIAAQAYQESHWDPKAQSPTGVRGLMMLTQRTADSLGIEDRLDPAQSIGGGARYLRRMLERLPEEIQEVDRTWFALAAYNVGMGHLNDARTLTARLGRDPASWYDVERTLPLLSQQHYFKQLKYGYARGLEPVRYVQRVRNYQDILEHALDEEY